MFLQLLKKIINKSEALNQGKVKVFILKGFPVKECIELHNQIPHIQNLSCLLEFKIDLKKVENSFWELGSRLNQLKNTSFIFYEEFLLLPHHSIEQFPIEFILIKNNFFEYYPNQSDISYPDTEDSVDNNIPLPDNITFQKFYSNSKSFEEIDCIQYLDYVVDVTSIGIKVIDLFDPAEYALPDIQLIKDISKEVDGIKFLASDNSYLKLKFSTFFNSVPASVKLIINENIHQIETDVDELKIVSFLLSSNGCNVSIIKTETVLVEEFTAELNILLKKHWGENSEFKNLLVYKNPSRNNDLYSISQGTIVDFILQQYYKAQKNEKQKDKQAELFKDVFLTAPTGAGKSLLFQLPAIFLSENEKDSPVSIIVSPLKALMEDQVSALKSDRKFNKVEFLNSDLSLIEREDIIEKTKSGEVSLLYMSPELLLSYDIKTFIGERNIGLLVIDEAHLVTTWGRDFRVDYWFLGNYIRKLRRGSSIKGLAGNKRKTYRFPVIAVTATAVYGGNDDMVNETIKSLNMEYCEVFIGKVKREEILFNIRKLITTDHDLDKLNKTKEQIAKFVEKKTKSIAYFPYKSQVNEVLYNSDENIKPLIRSYHSEIDKDNRKATLIAFKENRILAVLATKAFGMGVDVKGINTVYHHAPSGGLSDYIQEIGRVAREPNSTGNAIIDFNEKDLKYANSLYGLSAIRQYQVTLVLQKLNKLYQLKQNRNMLVSIEDFRFIFADKKDDQVEQKVKSALLVLEKDLIEKYGYNVLIVRPKSLFTTVYGAISSNDLVNMVEKFGSFVEEIPRQSYFKKTTKLANGAVILREEPDDSRFIKLKLDLIWEKHFLNESFPSLKYKYFNRELFPEIDPLLNIEVNFFESLNTSRHKFEIYLLLIERTLVSLGGYFSKEQIVNKFKEQLQSKAVSPFANLINEKIFSRLSDLLIVLYSETQNSIFTNNQPAKTLKFLQSKGVGENKKYRVINTALNQMSQKMMRIFLALFDGIEGLQYSGFFRITKGDISDRVKVAYLLEVFELATYKISGGKFPQLFIRINDPQKINFLSNSKYKNEVISDVQRRHDVSMELMSYFFRQKLSQVERWDFVEDYFLGRDVMEEALLKK